LKRVTALFLVLTMLVPMLLQPMAAAVEAATTEIPISREKPATASINDNTATPQEAAVDGNNTTRWGTKNVVFPAWIKIDLGAVYNIGYYDILWFVSDTRSYYYNIWVSDTDNWVSNTSVGSYTKVLDKTANTTPGRVEDEVDTSYMARYVLIDVTGRSTSSGNASISEANIYGWRLLPGGGYTVDEPNKTISGIGYGVTAADLLAAIDIDGNAETSVVDAGGVPVAGNVVLDSTHKLKATCTQGAYSALYDLSFTGLVSSDEYLVDYGMRTIDLQGRTDVTIADFLTDITYDDDAYSMAFYESNGSKIESNDSALAADMTLKVYAVSDVGETTPLDGYTFRDDAVAVTGVTLDKSELDLPKGSSERLTAAITPEDATDTRLKWSSSDSAVATVSSDGLVTAVAEGTATITVKSYDGLQSDACEVTVGLALEDGYALWLRYNKIADAGYRASASAALGYLVTLDEVNEKGEVNPVLVSALKELKTGLSGLFGAEMEEKATVGTAGGIVIGTKSSAEVTRLLSGEAATLAALQEEGYLIKSVDDGGKAVTVIAGGGANGVLYGAFKLLELVQCGEDVSALNYSDAPEIQWRVLQQWDNWSGSIERGYAGSSIYNWSELPGVVDPRYEDFARANASVGINTIVINNVNAQSNYIQTANISKVAAIADVFRKYGIRLALTVRFDSPQNVDGLGTNDPLDPTVVTWWQDKFKEIYAMIPDFAGVLVKADSEGQPGPSSYGRTHADGANMFADILDDHDAIVMWRTFVYGPAANALSSERVNQAYSFFKPLDGQFADNVIVQSKNGAWDFLPREPVAPLFGGLTKTNIGIELQITQEYTGQSTHVNYLVPMWKSYFDTDLKLTADDPDTSTGTTLDRVVDGTVYGRTNSLVAGVSNVGSDRNWTRLELAQANWYGFGKLAWNPRMDEATITDTWTKMTFGNDTEVVETVGEILRGSWETVEAYLMPYAIGMTVDVSTHLEPNLDSRNGSSSGIFVDANGVGSNRSSTSTGNNSDATAQYSTTLGAIYNNIDTCPEEFIGWFHHVPYDRVMTSKGNKTMIESLYDGFIAGPVKVGEMKEAFADLGKKIDAARMDRVLSSFDAQIGHATVWRNAMLDFFKKQSRIAIPGAMNLPGVFSLTQYAPEGTPIIGDAIALTVGQSVTLQASTQQGSYLATLLGTGTNAKVAVKIGGVDAGTITVDSGAEAWSNGAIEAALSAGSPLDTITLSVTQGSVLLTGVKVTQTFPVSLGKTVGSSSQESANPIENIADGNPGTRWAASNSNYPQWAKIDLGAAYNIGYYDLSWYISGNRTYQYNIWASTATDDWVSNANVGSYTKVLDKTANTTVGRVEDEVTTPYMARYILIDTTGKTPTAGNGAASLYSADVFGWRVESSKYIVDEPDKKISAVDLDVTALELLESISINGNATAIVVDGGGNRVPDSTQLTAAHKLKVTCTRGAGSAQYALKFIDPGVSIPDISAVKALNDKMVKPGTEVSVLGLPSTVTVTLSDGTTPSYPVVWNMASYAAALGTYVLEGTITLPPDGSITNNSERKAECTVRVCEGWDSGSQNNFNRIKFQPVVGKGNNTAVFEFDVVPNVASINGSILITDVNETAGDGSTNYDKYHIQIRFQNETGLIDAYDRGKAGGKDFYAENQISYAVGEIYHVRIVSKVAEQKYSAWITSPGGEPVLLADNYTFRSATVLPNGLGQLALSLAGGGSAAGRYTVFNFTASDIVDESIESVTLDKNTLSLTVGETAPLVATLLPDDAENKGIVWTSTHPEVASVSQTGFVTAIAQGRTTIRATSAADSTKYDECEVEVSGGSDILNGIISLTPGTGNFPIVAGSTAATIWVDASESAPVKRVVNDFRDDIERVTGLTPVISSAATIPTGPVVIVGTLDGSQAIKDLISAGSITQAEVNKIEGEWEAYLIKVIDEETLAVVGSDPRGAVFGVYEISEQMGVSPWYFFADVAVNTKLNVYIKAGTVLTDMPDVQYRGIFINDEEKLDRWSRQVFGDPNTMGPKTYAKIFELILRLKGNYMWAAMHVNSYNNVAGNIDLLHEYGIVLGSSHCDILLRTNVHEWTNWKNAYADSKGVSRDSIHYDYTVSKEAVLAYWRENVVRHKETEAQWTVGMRGIHDEGFDTANIMTAAYDYLGTPGGGSFTGEALAAEKALRQAHLMNEIIREQQAILLDVLGQDKYDKSFQAVIPYKEVLPIYNHPEFKLPENVTVIWCDDNHSIMRRMPDETERARSGGHGIYYHVSYWAPADQSYLWLSSAPLALIGEELDKSWEHGVQKAWVLNVGDIKPAEAEMTFFIRYGWDVEQYKNDADKFVEEWIGQQFGEEIGEEVADIQRDFYKHSNVRKVEHMQVGIFNQTYYGDEGAKRMAVYQDLFDRAQAIYAVLPEAQKLGFYELIQCKINWVYYVNKAYYYADKSNLAYDQGRMASADAFLALSLEADAAKKAEIAKYGTMANGKWYNFIDPENAAPPVTTQYPPGTPALVLGAAALGVVVEGEALPQENSKLTFSLYGQDAQFIDVFNKGAGAVNWVAETSQNWVKLTQTSGAVYDEVRLYVTIENIDSHKGETATITISDGTATKIITVNVENITLPGGFSGYVEAGGYVSVQAEHYSRITNKNPIVWRKINHLGRAFDGDVMQTYDPGLGMIAESAIATTAPSMEYDIYLTTTGTFPMEIYRVPTLNAKGQVRFAYSVDGGEPIVVSSDAVDEGQGTIWVTHLFQQIEKHVVTLPALTAGAHTIKLWMVDNFISIDKMVIYTGPDGILQTHLGPDESYHSVYHTDFSTTVKLLDRTPVEAAQKDLPATWGSGAFIESDGKVSIEAEYAMEAKYTMTMGTDYPTDIDAYAYHVEKADQSGNLVEGWRLTQSPTGMAMRVPDAGRQYTENKDWKPYSPELGYKVNFTTTGRYNVWVLWRFVDDASDSIRGGLDGTYGNNFNTAAFFSNSLDEKWHWKKVTTDINGNSGGMNITTAGEHTINFWMREDGVYIDRIYMTKGSEDPSTVTWLSSARSTPAHVDYADELKAYIADLRTGLNFPIGTTPGNYLQADYDAFVGVLNTEEANVANVTTAALYDAAVGRITAAEAALKAKIQLSDGTATYVAYQDFEGYETGRQPYGFAAGAASTVTDLANGATYKVLEENGNQFIRLQTVPGATHLDMNWSFLTPVPMAGNGEEMMIVEFSARMFEGLRYSNNFLPRIDGSGNYAMTVAFDNGVSLDEKNVKIRDGSTNKTVASLVFDQWHDFRVVANRVDKTYCVYMDGALIANNFSFRSTAGTNMTDWRLGIDDFVGRVDYDNMSVRLAKLYDVSADTVTGGAIAASRLAVSGTAIQMAKGERVTIAATPAADYHLVSGSLKAFKTGEPATLVPVVGNTFTMPDYAITITAEFAEDSAPTIPVSGVSLNKAAASLLVGGTETLAATVAPADASDKTVTWMSSNEAVATVTPSGVVTAVGVGTAIITATTADGGLTATCAVTVKANITAVASVAGITVVHGTAAATMAARLPATVEVTVSGGITAELPVVWSTTGYNATVAGSYPLTGTLTLPSDGDVINTSGLKANVTVMVKYDITGVDAVQGYSVPFGTELSNLPAKVYVTVSGGGRRELAVVWGTESYDKERAGAYTLDGALTLEADLLNTGALKASLIVTVLAEGTIVREVTEVANIAAKQVSYGTAAGNLGLPTKVTVTLDDGSETELEVVWNTLEYNGNLAGTYTLTGGLVETDGIVNPNGLTAEIKIAVQAQTGGGGNPVTPPKDAEPVVKPPVTVDKETGAANSTVSEKDLATALEAAKKTKSDVIVIKPAAPEGTSNVTVTIPATSAGALGDEKKAVVVDTPTAQITIGSTGLSGLSNGAQTISVGVLVNEDNSIAITIKADAEVIGKVDGGIVVTVPGTELGGTTVATLIREDGTEVILPKSVATADGMLVQLDGSATIKVIDNAKSMHDVPADQWMTDAVAFVAARGLFSGTAEGKFSPGAGMTRSMLATVLHRLELTPTGSGASFTDVADGQWYSGAVSWAAEAGIVSGVGGGRFDGDREISRAELVTMLYRYAGHIGLDTSAAADLSAFTDSEAVPGWSADAFAWAVSTGIISGSDAGELLPTASATRAQVAKVMMELVKILVG
jgi:alpha-glucuronidase/uncharacterized protein YjdB